MRIFLRRWTVVRWSATDQRYRVVKRYFRRTKAERDAQLGNAWNLNHPMYAPEWMVTR